MKYYSEKLDQIFDTAEELEKTEAQIVKTENEQKKLKEEIKEAIKQVEAAEKKVIELISEYENKYKIAHNSNSLLDFVEEMINFVTK